MAKREYLHSWPRMSWSDALIWQRLHQMNQRKEYSTEALDLKIGLLVTDWKSWTVVEVRLTVEKRQTQLGWLEGSLQKGQDSLESCVQTLHPVSHVGVSLQQPFVAARILCRKPQIHHH